MTAQLSRERLEKIAAWEIEITDAGTRHAPGAHSKVYSYEIVEMARMLLAGMDSEPLAYFYPGDETEWQGVALAEELDDEQKARCNPLYATPPAPVAVPDVDPRDAFEAVFPIPPHAERCGAGYCCTAYSAWGAQDFIQKWNGWNACCATMLKAGPLTRWIKCSERMPEHANTVITSNGIDIGHAWWDGDRWFEDDPVAEGITHWMPLPAAPEQEV